MSSTADETVMKNPAFRTRPPLISLGYSRLRIINVQSSLPSRKFDPAPYNTRMVLCMLFLLLWGKCFILEINFMLGKFKKLHHCATHKNCMKKALYLLQNRLVAGGDADVLRKRLDLKPVSSRSLF